MKSLISKALIATVLLIQSCSHSKTVQRDPRDLQTDSVEVQRGGYSRVPLEQLLDSIGRYQHKKVEIKGYYFCGFEHSCIQPELFQNKKLYDWTKRIWVETKNYKIYSCDSINKRIVLIQGILDTSRHGHMGEYVATIKKAVIEVQ